MGHVGFDIIWAKLLKNYVGREEQRQPAPSTANEATPAFRDSAALIVTTSGFVLGLLQVFSDEDATTTTLKVGSVALAVAILIALVVFNTIVHTVPNSAELRVLLAYMYTSMFFFMALGLASVAMSVVFRN
jgi:hypothetical protein